MATKTPIKTYYAMFNVGSVKYMLNYHDGIKTNSDGSDCYNIRIFKNKKLFEQAIKDLESQGYKPRPSF